MNLKTKSESILLSELKNLVTDERETGVKILHYFREIEARKIHLERGYSSFFDFAVKELGYSAGGAYRRISAMRLLKALPELQEKIESGVLSLSVAAQAQSFFREEGKVRKVSVQEKIETVESLLGLSTRECERKLAAISPSSALPKEKSRVVTEELMQIQFLADRDLMGKLEKLKGLLAHRDFDGSYQGLFRQLADLALKRLVPGESAPAPNESERQSLPPSKPVKLVPPSAPKWSRHLPRQVKSAVFLRDSGKCVYRDRKSGRVCGSSYALEYDHVVPFSMGGETAVENLRLLCSAHHRLESEKLAMLV